MGSVEAQLAEYRAKKARERSAGQSSVLGSLNILRSRTQQAKVGKQETEEEDVSKEAIESHDVTQAKQQQEYKPSWIVALIARNHYLSRIATYKYTPLILKVILWTALWGFFIEIEFGAVYFVISLLFVIYASLRTGPRSGPSAYSVFNENFETLEGTFTAEEFDNQLRRGGGMM